MNTIKPSVFEDALREGEYAVIFKMINHTKLPHISMPADTVEFLHTICNISFTASRMESAIRAGDAGLVKALHDNGCPWPRVNSRYVKHSVMKVLLKYGCPVRTDPVGARSAIFRNGLNPAGSRLATRLYTVRFPNI